jgi:hypothetical protein
VSGTSIKVIKRKDASVALNGETQSTSEPELLATMSGEKNERRLHRKIADTLSNWIAERRENNRAEEISAIRKLFGDESLLSKTACSRKF